MLKSRRLLAVLMCAVLVCAGASAAWAESFTAGEVTSPCEADLDGDGVKETLAVLDILKEEGEACLGLEVQKGDARVSEETEITGPWKLFLSDVDGNGLPEILFTGDKCSDDYITYCRRFADGKLQVIPFESGDVLAAGIMAVSPYRVEAFSTVNALGTYTGFKELTFEDGKLVMDSGDWLLTADNFDYTPMLTLKQDIYVISSVNAEGEYGEEMLLPAGTLLYLTATDGESTVSFITEGGVCGLILLEEDGQGSRTFVNGMPEEEVFEGISYAD